MQLLEDFDIAVALRLYIVALESKETAEKGRKLVFGLKMGIVGLLRGKVG